MLKESDDLSLYMFYQRGPRFLFEILPLIVLLGTQLFEGKCMQAKLLQNIGMRACLLIDPGLFCWRKDSLTCNFLKLLRPLTAILVRRLTEKGTGIISAKNLQRCGGKMRQISRDVGKLGIHARARQALQREDDAKIPEFFDQSS